MSLPFVSDEAFEKEVLQSPLPVLVFFAGMKDSLQPVPGSDRHIFSPQLERFAEENGGIFKTVLSFQHKEYASAQGRSIGESNAFAKYNCSSGEKAPAFMMFRNGALIAFMLSDLSGAATEKTMEKLAAFTKEAQASPEGTRIDPKESMINAMMQNAAWVTIVNGVSYTDQDPYREQREFMENVRRLAKEGRRNKLATRFKTAAAYGLIAGAITLGIYSCNADSKKPAPAVSPASKK